MECNWIKPASAPAVPVDGDHSGGYASGDYLCKCSGCGQEFVGAKRSCRCSACAIQARLKDACDGHPYAKIPWPHRLLHDAIDCIVALRAQAAPQDADKLRAENERLREALTECESEIDAYIRQEYPLDHPVHERYRQRDFDANPARAALSGEAQR